jgi:hypothetical protein
MVNSGSAGSDNRAGYNARQAYQAKENSLSQAASVASNLRYEPAARIARRFANLAAKAIAPFGKF